MPAGVDVAWLLIVELCELKVTEEIVALGGAVYLAVASVHVRAVVSVVGVNAAAAPVEEGKIHPDDPVQKLATLKTLSVSVHS